MVQTGNVLVYMGPLEAGAPDDLEQVIVDFISGAKKRLEIAVQELESDTIARAIVQARQRKVLVKLVVEQDYLRAGTASRNPWQPGGGHETNRTVHNVILRANIDVKVDYNSSIFHQKFIVRDGTAVLTGSTNFTPSGTHKNLNHVIIINDETVAKIYSREFREIQRGHFGKYNEGHDRAPADITVSGIPVRICFAPDHNPEMEIMKQMLKAQQRIDFAIFTFAKSSGIDDAMSRLHDLGIQIRGAFDRTQGGHEWSAIRTLKKKGVQLFGVSKSSKVGKLHHKLMVVDEQLVVGGSFNYTGPANRLNDENIIILGDLETTTSRSTKAQKRIGQAALNEIDRIIRDHGKRF